MENYFFINPKAGQGKGIDKLAANIEAAAAALGMTAKIYITKGVGDGERKARETAQSPGWPAGQILRLRRRWNQQRDHQRDNRF